MQQVSKVMKPPSRHTVLVVEDEILIRVDLATQLRTAGYEVVEADSAEEALTVLMGNTPVDAVVTDIRMPGHIDGMELVRWLRRRANHIKIVVVSAHIDPYWDLPVDATFTKPVCLKALLTRLRQLLPPAERSNSG